METKLKPGRPARKVSIRNFKLSAEADTALLEMSARMGWTMTMTVERALRFASSHKDFSR